MKTDELYNYLDRVRFRNRILENPFLPWAEDYHFEDQPKNEGQIILKALKITEKQIQLFLIDFIQHCFSD